MPVAAAPARRLENPPAKWAGPSGPWRGSREPYRLQTRCNEYADGLQCGRATRRRAHLRRHRTSHQQQTRIRLRDQYFVEGFNQLRKSLIAGHSPYKTTTEASRGRPSRSRTLLAPARSAPGRRRCCCLLPVDATCSAGANPIAWALARRLLLLHSTTCALAESHLFRCLKNPALEPSAGFQLEAAQHIDAVGNAGKPGG